MKYTREVRRLLQLPPKDVHHQLYAFRKDVMDGDRGSLTVPQSNCSDGLQAEPRIQPGSTVEHWAHPEPLLMHDDGSGWSSKSMSFRVVMQVETRVRQ